MGLSLLYDELAEAKQKAACSRTGQDKGDENVCDDERGRTSKAPLSSPNTANRASTDAALLAGWKDLAGDITRDAQSSVDVLNDLLNYDKIQMGNFKLELSILPVWNLVAECANEFRLQAMKKASRCCSISPRWRTILATFSTYRVEIIRCAAPVCLGK